MNTTNLIVIDKIVESETVTFEQWVDDKDKNFKRDFDCSYGLFHSNDVVWVLGFHGGAKRGVVVDTAGDRVEYVRDFLKDYDVMYDDGIIYDTPATHMITRNHFINEGWADLLDGTVVDGE